MKRVKEKINKCLNNRIFIFVLGILLSGSVSVFAAAVFPSDDVSYDNSASGMQSTDVQGAIDELYKTCTEKPSASDTITDLVDTNTDELYKDEHGDLRYYGSGPNNYVSFNNELWRIIGVIDGKIKIIRNESIGNYAWSSDGINNWNTSSLKSYLNGDYYNSIDETYKNMISEETYYLGGPTSSNYPTLTASGYYDAERDSSQVYSGNPASTEQYIGLMYPSDYGYAAGSSCLSTAIYDYYPSCKNTDYLFSGAIEWLQAPIASDSFFAVYLYSTGSVSGEGGYVYGSTAVRPVLYLNTNVKITGGEGTSSSPFTLG